MSAARILPPEEWDRLPEDVASFCSALRPEDVAAVVVEDDGVIVARVLMLRAPHMEAYWQAPERFGNAGITRALLRKAAAQAREWGSPWFMANAAPGPMCATLERLGGDRIPVHTFMLSSRLLAKEGECPRTSPEPEPRRPCRSAPTTGASPAAPWEQPDAPEEDSECRPQ